MRRIGVPWLWSAIAVAGLMIAPLPATADETAVDVPADQTTVVIGGCRTFDATNRYTEPVVLLYGDGAAEEWDWSIILEPGATARLGTVRDSVDYLALGIDSLLLIGEGWSVPIDRECTDLPAASANARYISRVYVDLFNRGTDPDGLAWWTNALDAGRPRVGVANAITSSREYRARLISGVYWEFLGRAPDAAGLAGWLAAMDKGVTIAQMESGFIASNEYYLQNGDTPYTWISAMYEDVLGRAATHAEVVSWVDVLYSRVTRQKIALGFLLSTERLNAVVGGHYQYLLGRETDPDGQAAWVRILQAGGRDEAIIGGIVASDEYYHRP